MTTVRQSHQTYIMQVDTYPAWYYSQCSCGWRSDDTRDEAESRDDAFEHKYAVDDEFRAAADAKATEVKP